MTYKIACGDVRPGCTARFESANRDQLLAEVARHAAQDHGIHEITPDMLDLVTAKIVHER